MDKDRCFYALDGFFAGYNIGGVPRFNSFLEAYDKTTAETIREVMEKRMVEEYNKPNLQRWKQKVGKITVAHDFRTQIENERIKKRGKVEIIARGLLDEIIRQIPFKLARVASITLTNCIDAVLFNSMPIVPEGEQYREQQQTTGELVEIAFLDGKQNPELFVVNEHNYGKQKIVLKLRHIYGVSQYAKKEEASVKS